jgi:hypothetical protein
VEPEKAAPKKLSGSSNAKAREEKELFEQRVQAAARKLYENSLNDARVQKSRAKLSASVMVLSDDDDAPRATSRVPASAPVTAPGALKKVRKPKTDWSKNSHKRECSLAVCVFFF